MTTGEAATGYEAPRGQVLQVVEVLPGPQDRVWRALTDPDLIARWLMPNDFKLQAGHRWGIDSDPIRACGLGGTGSCEVLAFDEGTMLRIAWTAAGEDMRYLNSTVTFTLVPDGAGTRLLIEHDGFHPCGYTIFSSQWRADGCQTFTRHIGEVSATTGAWRAAIQRISEALAEEVAEGGAD